MVCHKLRRLLTVWNVLSASSDPIRRSSAPAPAQIHPQIHILISNFSHFHNGRGMHTVHLHCHCHIHRKLILIPHPKWGNKHYQVWLFKQVQLETETCMTAFTVNKNIWARINICIEAENKWAQFLPCTALA